MDQRQIASALVCYQLVSYLFKLSLLAWFKGPSGNYFWTNDYLRSPQINPCGTPMICYASKCLLVSNCLQLCKRYLDLDQLAGSLTYLRHFESIDKETSIHFQALRHSQDMRGWNPPCCPSYLSPYSHPHRLLPPSQPVDGTNHWMHLVIGGYCITFLVCAVGYWVQVPVYLSPIKVHCGIIELELLK